MAGTVDCGWLDGRYCRLWLVRWPVLSTVAGKMAVLSTMAGKMAVLSTVAGKMSGTVDCGW